MFSHSNLVKKSPLFILYIYITFKDHPDEFKAEELDYATRAAKETITCFFPYPCDFVVHNKFLSDAITSASARYKRICEYHPGVVCVSGWTSHTKSHRTGYPGGFPYDIYRADFILGVLYHHFDITKFDHNTMKHIITLRLMATRLTAIYTVKKIKCSNHQTNKKIPNIAPKFSFLPHGTIFVIYHTVVFLSFSYKVYSNF